MLRRTFFVSFFALTLAGAASAVTFTADLEGGQEVPPVITSGAGFATLVLSDDQTSLSVDVAFASLLGATAAGHIHCCAPVGVNAGIAIGFGALPLGVMSGSFMSIFDLTMDDTYNPAFFAANGSTAEGARTALLSAMNSQNAYVNIHTTQVPSGEIRGQIEVVPEPATWTLLGAGAALALWMRRRR